MRTATLSLVLAAMLLAPSASAQTAPTPEEQRRMAELYRRANEPGEPHARLAVLEGTWNTEARVWPGPGAEPKVVRGTARNEMILGGRFLATESTASLDGASWDALLVTGYDGRHGHYTQVAFDTWGTYYVTAAGDRSEEAGAIVMSGEDRDPILGHTQVYDFILRIVDADRYVTEIVFKDPVHDPGGAGFKMVEIVHTRANEEAP